MERTPLARRSSAALAAHAPHLAGAVGLATLALLVLPFDGPVATAIIGLIAGFVGGRISPWVAAHLFRSN